MMNESFSPSKLSNILEKASKLTLVLSIFEEIGLAELSPFNSLKVLHSFLERPKISFVGISNWVSFVFLITLEFGCFENEPSAAFTAYSAKLLGANGNSAKHLKGNGQ